VLQISGQIAYFLKHEKYKKQSKMIQRLVKKGMVHKKEVGAAA